MANRIAEINPKADIYEDYQENQVCYTRSTKYAIPGLPSMLYQEYQVCYIRTTKYAIPGLPSMIYQENQVCYTRTTKYAIPGQPSMLYQENQYAIPGEPRMFHKENQKGNIKPGQWLKEYERVSKYKRWDETMKLANVVFYLNGTAGRWFDNIEESLNSWRSFDDAFRGVFVVQEDSARRAEEVLKSRAQKAKESSESYIQKILSLCHQVNHRTEEEKLFYKVGVDLFGRFPVSKDGNCWIIVCTDYMTRYAITKAILDGGAIETAKFLVEVVILKHGAPRKMITDRERNFISKVIKEINALCGIVHRFTTAYHPLTNGLTKRFDKTLGDMLSMYTGVEQKDWDQVLPYVTFSYNTDKQEASGHTPFFLVHAPRKAGTYIVAVLPYLKDEISDDYVRELVSRAEEARQLSRSRFLQSQAKDRRLYDHKHTPVYYQKDDLVWVFTSIRKVGLSEKLLKRYFGPYKVTKSFKKLRME
ncbi:hypothetical protein LAZ67_20001480 [Cordylochernes scorpioides]|uniref:Integrase catalytic domain-containing protein n=1 Tax=Cordylochernes scorpioides TaxID=51811 RepID=A0ABY6LPV8_9ARAC|nr:hypothetical protein LAZ67_20001480 [Cordylochernes scorpioides]